MIEMTLLFLIWTYILNIEKKMLKGFKVYNIVTPYTHAVFLCIGG